MIKPASHLKDSQVTELRYQAPYTPLDMLAEQYEISVIDTLAIIRGELRSSAPGLIVRLPKTGLFHRERLHAMSAAIVNRAAQVLNYEKFQIFADQNGLTEAERVAGTNAVLPVFAATRERLYRDGLGWVPEGESEPEPTLRATPRPAGKLIPGGFICELSLKRLLRKQFSVLYNYFPDQLCDYWGGGYGQRVNADMAYTNFSRCAKRELPEGMVWLTRIEPLLDWGPDNLKPTFGPDPIYGFPYEPYLSCSGEICTLQDASILLSIPLEELESLKVQFIDDQDIVDACIRKLTLPRECWPRPIRRVKAAKHSEWVGSTLQGMASFPQAKGNYALLKEFKAWLEKDVTVEEQILVLNEIHDKLYEITQ